MRGGAVPLERPRPLCGCQRGTRPAPDGGSPGPAVHGSTRRRDPAVIEPTLTVAVGQATTVPPARHSTLVGSGMNPGSGVVPGGGRVCPASGSWSSHRRYAGCAAPPVGEREEWPVILRHLGRGHGRSPDHRPHGGYSAFVGGGESHEMWRDRQLYGVEKPRHQRAAPAPAGTLTGKRDIRRRIRGRARRASGLEAPDPEDTVSTSAETRRSCAARHTLHGAARGRQ